MLRKLFLNVYASVVVVITTLLISDSETYEVSYVKVRYSNTIREKRIKTRK